MALEDTLKLKVELDQSDLGLEIANIRENIAAAATPMQEPAVSNISGAHPSNKESIFWGLGAAAQQMGGDFSQATGFAGNIAQSVLATGAVVGQVARGDNPYYAPYQSPFANTPIQLGPGGAIKNQLFGSSVAPFLSDRQSDQVSSQYFSNVFSGTSGTILGAEMGVGAAQAGLWAVPGIGIATGLLGGAVLGMAAQPGLDRLGDIQTLQNLGLSRGDATATMGGGFWAGIGSGMSSLNPFNNNKEHLAGVWSDGINVNGRQYTGLAAAGMLLDQGQMNVSGAGIQAGMLAMNELVTRTGMDLGSASQLVNGFSAPGALNNQGNITAMQTIGMLGPGNSIGMNTRSQNAWMPHLLQNAQTGMSQWGHSFGLARAQGTMMLANTFNEHTMFNSDMAGAMGGASGMNRAFNNTMFGAQQSAFGSGTLSAAAISMVASGATDPLDFFSGGDVDLSASQVNRDSQTVMGMGEVGYSKFMFMKNKIASDPTAFALSYMNVSKQKEGQSDEDYVRILASRSGMHSPDALEAFNSAIQIKRDSEMSITDKYYGHDKRIEGLKYEGKWRDKVSYTFTDYSEYRKGGYTKSTTVEGRALDHPEILVKNAKGKHEWVSSNVIGSPLERLEALGTEGYLTSDGTFIDTSNGASIFGSDLFTDLFDELDSGAYDHLGDMSSFKDFSSKLREGGLSSMSQEDFQALAAKALTQSELAEDGGFGVGTGDKNRRKMDGFQKILHDIGVASGKSSMRGSLGGVAGSTDYGQLMRTLSEAAKGLADLHDKQEVESNVR